MRQRTQAGAVSGQPRNDRGLLEAAVVKALHGDGWIRGRELLGLVEQPVGSLYPRVGPVIPRVKPVECKTDGRYAWVH